MSGMKPDDVAIITDADETFTRCGDLILFVLRFMGKQNKQTITMHFFDYPPFSRDFLRALQVCDIPEFREGQNCHSPKLLGSTLVLESSAECITKGRRLHHPGEKVLFF